MCTLPCPSPASSPPASTAPEASAKGSATRRAREQRARQTTETQRRLTQALAADVRIGVRGPLSAPARPWPHRSLPPYPAVPAFPTAQRARPSSRRAALGCAHTPAAGGQLTKGGGNSKGGHASCFKCRGDGDERPASMPATHKDTSNASMFARRRGSCPPSRRARARAQPRDTHTSAFALPLPWSPPATRAPRHPTLCPSRSPPYLFMKFSASRKRVTKKNRKNKKR